MECEVSGWKPNSVSENKANINSIFIKQHLILYLIIHENIYNDSYCYYFLMKIYLRISG